MESGGWTRCGPSGSQAGSLSRGLVLPQFGALKDDFGQNSSFWKPRLVLQRRTALVEIVKNWS